MRSALPRLVLLSLGMLLGAACTTTSESFAPGSAGPLRVGFARVTILDADNFGTLFETYDDIWPERVVTHPDGTTELVRGNGYFEGCADTPAGPASGRSWCREPFHDTNGNGWFDGAFLAGFGSSRPATGVHDPIEVVAWVLEVGDRRLAFATLDAIGYHYDEVAKIRETLAAQGYRYDTFIVSATHDHEAPDVMGQWGPDASGDLSLPLRSGATSTWLAHVRARIAEAIVAATRALEPATLCLASGSSATNPLFATYPELVTDFFGAGFFKDVGIADPEASGTRKWQVEGLENDWRDPFVINHTINVAQFRRADGSVIGTVANVHSHAETLWSRNTLATADYPGYVRRALEALYPGSVGVHVSGSVGGIVGPYDVPVWAVDERGTPLTQTVTDPATGVPRVVPVVAPERSFTKARSLGWAYARIAAEALAVDARCATTARVRTAHEELAFPVYNPAFLLGAFLRYFPRTFYEADGRPRDRVDLELVRALGAYPDEPLGYVRTRIDLAVLDLGTSGIWTIVSAPGELFPESLLGLPADLEDPQRVHDYWPQGREKHVESYRLRFTLTDLLFAPLAGARPHHYLFFGLGNDELGYLVPEADFLRYHPLLDEEPPDHYEESNSTGPGAEPTLEAAYRRLLERLE